jgi:HAD superfamily hydrolase (TIGR01450 family)
MVVKDRNTLDFWGKDARELKKIMLFLFDMDGTIYKESKVFDGTYRLLDRIIETGGKYVFITNNSSQSVDDYIKKVNGLGIKAEKDNFFTSAQATVHYLKKKYKNPYVYCQGTKSMLSELSNEGIEVTSNTDRNVEAVIVGFDTELTSSKLRKTCQILTENDIPFIATNPDLRCPVSFGFVPDCGSICQMITAATGKKPTYIGKPEPVMVDFVREKYGFSKEETVVIGDRLYTDIVTGMNAGVTSICVLTGEATPSDIKRGVIKPDFTFESVNDIWKVLTV